MGRLDEPDWWWQYGLDGIGGAVVGGLVTVLALFLTLRHERRMADVARVRELVGQVHAHAWAREADLNAASSAALMSATFQLQAVSRRRFPLLSQVLMNLMLGWTLLSSDVEKRIEGGEARDLTVLLYQWMADPGLWTGSWLCRARRWARIRAGKEPLFHVADVPAPTTTRR